MRAAALVLALVGLNACSSAIVKASFNSNFVPPPSAATVSGAQASVRVTSTGGAAAFASMLFIAALVSARPVPELDPERRISEQDCTRPVDYSLGNIRCR